VNEQQAQYQSTAHAGESLLLTYALPPEALLVGEANHITIGAADGVALRVTGLQVRIEPPG
jgi:hypothetical protein